MVNVHKLTPIIAEVADKEPTFSSVYGFAVFLSAICLLLGLWRPWGIALASVIAAVPVMLTFSWLRDPNEGPAILHELGQSYMTHSYIAGFSPAIFSVMGFCLGLFLQRRRRFLSSY